MDAANDYGVSGRTLAAFFHLKIKSCLASSPPAETAAVNKIKFYII